MGKRAHVRPLSTNQKLLSRVMGKLRYKRTDVEKYLPNYFLSEEDLQNDPPVFQYLVAVGCILVVCLTLFMGTITWSGDRPFSQASLETPTLQQVQSHSK